MFEFVESVSVTEQGRGKWRRKSGVACICDVGRRSRRADPCSSAAGGPAQSIIVKNEKALFCLKIADIKVFVAFLSKIKVYLISVSMLKNISF